MWRGGSVPLGERLSIRAYRPPVSSESARTVKRQPRDHTEDCGSARRAYCAAAPWGSIVMRLLLPAPGGWSLLCVFRSGSRSTTPRLYPEAAENTRVDTSV